MDTELEKAKEKYEKAKDMYIDATIYRYGPFSAEDYDMYRNSILNTKFRLETVKRKLEER